MLGCTLSAAAHRRDLVFVIRARGCSVQRSTMALTSHPTRPTQIPDSRPAHRDRNNLVDNLHVASHASCSMTAFSPGLLELSGDQPLMHVILQMTDCLPG